MHRRVRRSLVQLSGCSPPVHLGLRVSEQHSYSSHSDRHWALTDAQRMVMDGLCAAELSTAAYASDCCMLLFVAWFWFICLCCDCVYLISCAMYVCHVPRLFVLWLFVPILPTFLIACDLIACTLNACDLIVRVHSLSSQPACSWCTASIHV